MKKKEGGRRRIGFRIGWLPEGDDAWEFDDDVHEVDEVACAVEDDLGLLPELDGGAEGLLHRLEGEVGVPVVPEPEEGHGGALVDVGVHGAEGDHLGQDARGRGPGDSLVQRHAAPLFGG